MKIFVVQGAIIGTIGTALGVAAGLLLAANIDVVVPFYTYAVAPYDDWHRQASAAALVLVALVLVLNIGARIVFRARGESR